jgi:hypothetical protein
MSFTILFVFVFCCTTQATQHCFIVTQMGRFPVHWATGWVAAEEVKVWMVGWKANDTPPYSPPRCTRVSKVLGHLAHLIYFGKYVELIPS